MFSAAQSLILSGGARGVVTQLVKIDHPGGALRFSLLPYDWVDAASDTWIGGGLALSIGPVDNTLEGPAAPLRLTLSGADTGLRAYVLDSEIEDARLTRYIAFHNDAGVQVDALRTVFVGRCNRPSATGGRRDPAIELTAESRLMRLFKPRPIFASPGQHQTYFPGDDGFKEVASVARSRVVSAGPAKVIKIK